MTITRHELESCCGSKTLLFELDKCILQSHLQAFLDAGFVAPKHFQVAGIFYVDRSPIIASGAFGSKNIHVRCSVAKTCSNAIDEFQKLIEDIIK